MKSYYDEGEAAGEVAARSAGGTRGAEWLADQRGLTGTDRAEFIAGFDEALSRCESNDLREENT